MARLGSRGVAVVAGRRAKWLVVAVWLVAVVAAVPLGGRLSGVAADGDTVEMPRGAEATEVAELTGRFLDGQVSAAIVVYVRQSGLTAADRSKVDADRRALTRLAAGPDAAPVPSADGTAMLLAVPLSDDATLADRAAEVRDQARAGLPAGLAAKLTGPAGNALDARDANDRTNRLVTLVTVLVIAILLLVIYRSPVLWLLPLLGVAVASVMVRALEYLLGEYVGMTIDPQNSAVVTVLLFGVGTDYAMLLLARYRDELRGQADRHTAMASALRAAAPAIVASAATVSLGLLCLLAARMGFNYTLGTAGAIAVICALAVTVTLLPALLVILGRWAFWPLVPRPETGHRPHSGVFAGLGRGVARHPRLVWLVAALVLGTLALGLTGMRTGLRDQDRISGTPESVAGQRLLADHFPAGQSRPVEVVSNADASSAVRRAVDGIAGVSAVNAPVRSTDGALVRIDAVLADSTDSASAEATVDRIRLAVHALPGADARVGGATAQRMERDAAQAHDRKVVIPLVLLVVFAVLILLLRAVVGSLLLMATVVLSYSAALGASWLLFDHVLGYPAVDTQLALVGFLFLVALGVDYNIFLVSRVREETVQSGYRGGVLAGLAATGAVITGAGMVLAATFAALNLAPQVAFKEIGTLVALGVLLDTLLVRSVLVPALALDAGPAFWWPTRPLRRRPAGPGREAPREPSGAGQRSR